MYPLAIVLGIAAFRRDGGIWRYAVPLAATGLAISIYHTFIEWFPNLDAGFCSLEVPCSAAYVTEFGFVGIPFMAGMRVRHHHRATAGGPVPSGHPLSGDPCMTTPHSRSDSAAPQPSRTPLVVGVVVALVLVAGLVAWLVTRSSGDGDAAEAPVFGEVSVEGEALPGLAEGADPSTDPAVGTAAPVVSGTDFAEAAGHPRGGRRANGDSLPGARVPALPARRCPLCRSGSTAEGYRMGTQILSVATAQDSDAAQLPPGGLARGGGLDTASPGRRRGEHRRHRFRADGLPFWVFLDSAGNVAARAIGGDGPGSGEARSSPASPRIDRTLRAVCQTHRRGGRFDGPSGVV